MSVLTRKTLAPAATATAALTAALVLALPSSAQAGVVHARIGDNGAGPGYGTFCEYPITAKADTSGYVVFTDWVDATRQPDPAAFRLTVIDARANTEVTTVWRPQVPGQHTIYVYQAHVSKHVKLHVNVTRGMHLGSACAALPW